MNLPKLSKLSVAILAATLSACGGGGSTPAAPTITTTAEGVYTGTVSNGDSFDGVILEDGTYYVLAGPRTVAGLTVTGLTQGNGTSNNGNFTSTNLVTYPAIGAPILGSLAGTYGTNTINGTTSVGGIVANTFTGTTPLNSTYVYNMPTNLANITGAWTLADMQGGSIAMTITPTGSFTATALTGCIIQGTLTPRASGKNVFDLAGVFGIAPCASPGLAFSGIAVDYLLANGIQRQLVLAGVNAPRTGGTSLFGVR